LLIAILFLNGAVEIEIILIGWVVLLVAYCAHRRLLR